MYASGTSRSSNAAGAYVRGELQTLDRDAGRAQSRTRDRMTRLHLQDIQARIDDILNPDS